ncbi:MAG: hypothetical protein ACLPVF_01275 [Acidimicrobiales bacterium]
MASTNSTGRGTPPRGGTGSPSRFVLLLGRLGLVVAALVGTSAYLVLATTDASASHHKKSSHHSTSHKGPCLVGKWTVTNLTFNASGITASGGAGTLVDIAANRYVVGSFTPGAPLTSSAGSIKFSGTDYGTYGFSTKSTAKTGTFPVTFTSAANVTISVNGAPPTPTAHTATTGSYVCAGKGLKLTFPAGGDELVYTLVPTK